MCIGEWEREQLKLVVRIQFNNFPRKIYLYLNSNFMWCDFMRMFALCFARCIWVGDWINGRLVWQLNRNQQNSLKYFDSWKVFSSIVLRYSFSASVEQCNNKLNIASNNTPKKRLQAKRNKAIIFMRSCLCAARRQNQNHSSFFQQDDNILCQNDKNLNSNINSVYCHH